MTTKLIGITARRGRGKTTFALMLAELLPEAEVVAFADALKLDVLDMVNETRAGGPFGSRPEYTLADLERDKATCWGPILQGYGELMRQEHGQDYWCERLAETLEDARGAGAEGCFIVADVRHPNEVDWIKEHGGVLVALKGPCRLDGDTRSDSHPSEANVEACAERADIRLENTGTLDTLRGVAETLVVWLRGYEAFLRRQADEGAA